MPLLPGGRAMSEHPSLTRLREARAAYKKAHDAYYNAAPNMRMSQMLFSDLAAAHYELRKCEGAWKRARRPPKAVRK